MSRDVTYWYDTFTIDKGSNSSVEENMGVIYDGYLVGLVKYMITGGQENKIWLEKKACLKRDYRITVIIDGSVSCFNIINLKHSIKTIFTFLKILSLIEIPYFDLIFYLVLIYDIY